MQIIWEGKAKWYEIMSMFPTAWREKLNGQNEIMSMFPTELASESNT